MTNDNKQGNSQKGIDEIYEDRNLLACALAQVTSVPSGWKPDLQSPDEWAIVWIETPNGQISWHVPIAMIEKCNLPKQDVVYDGYDRQVKNERLESWITGAYDQ